MVLTLDFYQLNPKPYDTYMMVPSSSAFSCIKENKTVLEVKFTNAYGA